MPFLTVPALTFIETVFAKIRVIFIIWYSKGRERKALFLAENKAKAIRRIPAESNPSDKSTALTFRQGIRCYCLAQPTNIE